MKELKKEPLVNLVDRLRKIDDEMKTLTNEYNIIINELWNRVPTLKEDELFQQIEEPKVMVKK